jgi:hypothetical protein
MENALPFEIKNEKTVQEVVAKDGSVSGMVFYEAGKSTVLGGIATSNPCVLMLKQKENEIQLSLADPTQKLKDISFVIAGEYSGNNTTVQDGKTIINVVLPQDEKAGKTVTLNLTKK